MNRNNGYIPHSGAIDQPHPGLDAVPLRAWRWIVIGQLWMLAAFAGGSLVVIAAISAFHGGAGHGRVTLAATGCAGALLIVLAWQGVARMLQHVDREEPRGPGPGAPRWPRMGATTGQVPAQAAVSGMTPSW